jgi:Phytanoyl-CoA dioxygenase (PhyH)
LNELHHLASKFCEDGYVCVPKVLDAAFVSEVKQQIVDWSGMKDSHAYRRLKNPTEVSSVFFDLAFRSPLTELIGALIGPNVVFHHGKVHRGSPSTGWHRDICSHPLTNARLLTCEYFLDDVDREHGALAVVPGSHVLGFAQPWETLILGQSLGDGANVDLGKATSLEMKAGDASIHHGLTLHNVLRTSATRDRDVLIFTYCAAEAAPLAPETTGCAHYRQIVTGRDARWVSAESTAVVFSESCIGEDGKPNIEKRELGLRMRGAVVSLM